MSLSKSAHFAMNDLVEAHERHARGQPGGRRLVAKFTDWSGGVFQKRCFDDAELSGAMFVNTTLIASSFKFATLYCASFAGADVRGVNFFRADLRGAELRGANFQGARLDEADFREATYIRQRTPGDGHTEGEVSETITRRVDFSDCTLRRARFGKAKLAGANFAGANLSGADLDGAEFDEADFTGTILTGVDLKKIRLPKECLSRAVLDPSRAAFERREAILTMIEEAETWAATSGSSGRLLTLTGEDIRPLAGDLSDVHLPLSTFTDIRAIGCNFSRSLLAGSVFERCDLREADFTDADLRGVRFENCRMNEADLRRARLGPVNFADQGIRDTEFGACSVFNLSLSPGVAERYGLVTTPVLQSEPSGMRRQAAG